MKNNSNKKFLEILKKIKSFLLDILFFLPRLIVKAILIPEAYSVGFARARNRREFFNYYKYYTDEEEEKECYSEYYGAPKERNSENTAIILVNGNCVNSYLLTGAFINKYSAVLSNQYQPFNSMDENVERIIEMIDRLVSKGYKLENISFFGYSMGGMLLQKALNKYNVEHNLVDQSFKEIFLVNTSSNLADVVKSKTRRDLLRWKCFADLNIDADEAFKNLILKEKVVIHASAMDDIFTADINLFKKLEEIYDASVDSEREAIKRNVTVCSYAQTKRPDHNECLESNNIVSILGASSSAEREKQGTISSPIIDILNSLKGKGMSFDMNVNRNNPYYKEPDPKSEGFSLDNKITPPQLG
jgi:hypothetical protein